MVPVYQKYYNLARLTIMEKHRLPIQLPSLRVVVGSLGFYQEHKVNHDCSQVHGPQDNNVHRQHTHLSGVSDSGQGTHSNTDLPTGKPRFGNKLSLISNNIESGYRISGFSIYSTSMELQLPGDKIEKNRGEAKHLLTQRDSNALALSRFLGTESNHTTQAIRPDPQFYRILQIRLKEVLD